MLARRLLAAAVAGSPLEFVGANSGGWLGATSGDNTVSLTDLSGGISSSAQAGDFVIAVYGTASTANRTLAITDGTTAYTLVDSELYANATHDTNLRVAYKRLTGADGSVTFGPTGNTNDPGVGIVYVWRGVNEGSPLDVNAVTSTSDGERPNPPEITPVTLGSKIVVIGAGAGALGTMVNFTASYLSAFQIRTSADANEIQVGVGYLNWTGGAYNPALFDGGSTSTSGCSAAVTLALRPT